MTFILLSSSNDTQFEVCFQQNCLIFGQKNAQNACFSIHSSRFQEFYEKIVNMIKEHNSPSKVKKYFYKNFAKSHVYCYDTFLKDDQEKTFCINLTCQHFEGAELCTLTLNLDELYKFLRCFKYFIISTLLIDSNKKLWLKYCSTLRSLELQHVNLHVVLEEAKKFVNIFQMDCDLFELCELFAYYFPLVNVYRNLTLIEKSKVSQ